MNEHLEKLICQASDLVYRCRRKEPKDLVHLLVRHPPDVVGTAIVVLYCNLMQKAPEELYKPTYEKKFF
jgi:hypothetical protein